MLNLFDIQNAKFIWWKTESLPSSIWFLRLCVVGFFWKFYLVFGLVIYIIFCGSLFCTSVLIFYTSITICFVVSKYIMFYLIVYIIKWDVTNNIENLWNMMSKLMLRNSIFSMLYKLYIKTYHIIKFNILYFTNTLY